MSDVNSTPIINQILLRKWAYYGSTYLGNDLWYLKEFIELCLQDIGEIRVVKMLREDTGANKERLNGLGNNWLRFRRSYFKWSQDIGKAKLLYDILEKKEFNKLKDKNINVFLRHISSMTLIEPDLYALAVFLLNKSNIRGQTIKSEDWKVLEHTNLKKLEVTPRKPMLDSGVKHESS